MCASGGAVATVDLEVATPSTRATGHPLPLRTINRVEEGDTILYRPVLRPHETRKGDVTLVLIPADKKATGQDKVLVFESRPAAQPQQWKVPWRTAFVAFVYGPSGLSVKKVEAFLNRDDELVSQLADYADKTAKTEALIAALSSSGNSYEAVNAALQGFSSKFGANVQLTKGTPSDQQAMTIFRNLNPDISTYDPLASQGAQPFGQTAGLATSVAEMFFGSPVGLAAGGTAMLLNLRAIAFPRSEFRSAFSQPMPNDALGLCGKVGEQAAHTRIAYLWAVRVPNAALPHLRVGQANSLPAAVKSPVPIAAPEEDWKYLDRARNWTLQPASGKPIAVKAQVLANAKSLELDLGKDVKPGRYTIAANWDWDPFQVAGAIDVRPLADFTSAKLTPQAQDSLVGGAGKLPLTLQGADFEFVTKVELKKLYDEFASASAVPFVLPQGIREGVQSRMDIQVDASGLDPGSYQLIVSQVDGKPHDVALHVLPGLPEIDNLPVTVNQDAASTVSFDLKGKRLELLQRVELSQGAATLGAVSDGGSERAVTFKLMPRLMPGASLSLRAYVVGRNQPMDISSAVRIVAPRPSIASATTSALPPQTVQLENGELPSGLAVSAMLQVAHLPPDSGVTLECEQAGGAIALRPGHPNGNARVEQLSSGQLLVTFDTAAWSSGCTLEAIVNSGVGDSAPYRIARIVRVPAIEQFDLGSATDGADPSGMLIGRNLETVEKIGWDPTQGANVSSLPQPLPGEGFRQQLQVRLPAPPSSDAPLYIWLRGESKARATTVRAN